EAMRQAEAMSQAPVLAWNGSQEDALAAQQAVIKAQVIDPMEAQRAAEAAAFEQARQQEAMNQAMAMSLGAEVLHGGQESQERARIVEERQAAAEERADWRNRAAEIEGPEGEYARGVAELAEQKRLELGQQLLEQAEAGELPQWAQKLGPVPEDPTWRERWIERAGSVAAYREAHQHENERDAIGQRPGRGAVDVRHDWDRAYRALGEPEERMELVGASDATLRRMVERYDRETEWAPPHVAGQLREVSESLSDAERESVQTYIKAMEAETSEQAQELQEAVDGYEALTASLAEDREKLEKVHEARQAWHEHTEPTRQQAQEAQRQLELRMPEPEPVELPEDVQPELERERQVEAMRQAEAMSQAPVLAWNGSQEDALAAQQAVIKAQVIDPMEAQRAAEAAAAEQARQQEAEQMRQHYEAEALRQSRERAHETAPKLTGEELQEAVRTAGRATEILADREQTQQMEEAERARRDEPQVVQAPEPPAAELRRGREVEM
ncbi:hypothetical protein V5N34_29485, partial [Streptomyces baarnensis]